MGGLVGSITTVFKILTFVAIFVGALVFVYLKFIRKNKSAASEETTHKLGKIRDSAEFIPIEAISGNIVKVKGEQRFVGSINCKGFDFFSSDIGEQYRAQDGYLNFVNIIQSPITLRIDSSAVDLSASINRHNEIYNRKFAEQSRLFEQFSTYVKNFRNASTEGERQLCQSALNDIKKKLDTNEWKMEHLEHLISYQKKLSERKASPLQEERYIFDWEFNPADFPATITEKEIYERAQMELDKKEQRLRHALSAANVKVQRDGEGQLFNLFYRHFHPWSADAFKTLADSNVEERIVSGKRSFDRAKRQYEEALRSDDISQILEIQPESLVDTEELNFNFDEEEDDDYNIDSVSEDAKDIVFNFLSKSGTEDESSSEENPSASEEGGIYF